jgi:hypothetical protein
MRRLIIMSALAGLMALGAASATPAGAKPPAKPPGVNGQIVFGRFDPSLGETVFDTVNPDGTHERQVLPLPLECPNWSPDGTRIASCGGPRRERERDHQPRHGRLPRALLAGSRAVSRLLRVVAGRQTARLRDVRRASRPSRPRHLLDPLL